MSTYVTQLYSRTVFQTSDIYEVEAKVAELAQNFIEGKLFKDPDFGPTEADPKGELSIFYPPDDNAELGGDASVGQFNNLGGLNIDDIRWLRPYEFAKEPGKSAFITEDSDSDEDEEVHNLDDFDEFALEEVKPPKPPKKPKEVIEGIEKGKHSGASSVDVVQGNLGDCWLISAIILVAMRDYILEKMFCGDAFKKYQDIGLFVFRLNRNCNVHYVVVDSLIPCLERANGSCLPAFARCRNTNEYWVSLVEKAYAKLSIRYANLTSGFIDEGLQDMTGLAPEMIKFTSNDNRDVLWNIIKILSDTDSLIGVSLNFLGKQDKSPQEIRELQNDARHKGIQYGHAYGLLDLREVEDDEGNMQQLLRIKNPWGKDNKLEWNGDWCDSDTRWTEAMRRRYNEVGLMKNTKQDKEELIHNWESEDDNIFIMSFDDFRTYFNTIMAVRDYPDEWSGIRYFTSWSPSYGVPPRGKNWYRNPQFPFTLKNSTSVSVRLQQPDPRSIAENRPPFRKKVILTVVFKLEPTEKMATAFEPSNIVMQSRGSDSRCVDSSGVLKPGRYSIVIMSTDEGGFSDCYLSVYFNCSHDEIAFDEKGWVIILEEEEPGERLHRASTSTKERLISKFSAHPALSNLQEKKTSKLGAMKQAIKDKRTAIVEKAMNKQDLQSLLRSSKSPAAAAGAKPAAPPRKGYKWVANTAFGKIYHTQIAVGQEEKPKPMGYMGAVKQMVREMEKNAPETEDSEMRLADRTAKEIDSEKEVANMLGFELDELRVYRDTEVEEQERQRQEFWDASEATKGIVDLNYYGLGTKGLTALATSIEDCPDLEELWLRENSLTDTGIALLCSRLEASRQTRLKVIDISSNPELTVKSAEALLALSRRMPKGCKVIADGTGIPPGMIAQLASLR
mmetsp:Transcript_787/g.1521  ORF Transcript_787/g.1521 Transcript_787/m.1521 type:complete len:899 (+) Transcript_787:6532-9228(+)